MKKIDLDKIKKYIIDNKTKIIIAAVMLLIIIVIIVAINIPKDSKTTLKDSPFYSEVFFFRGNEKQTHLYNDDGEKVIKEGFNAGGTFICNNAIVSNKDGDQALINSKGEIVIDYDEYKSIDELGGSYVVNSKLLLDCNGNRVKDISDYEINRKYKASTSITFYDKDTLYIYNYQGKEIGKLKFKNLESVVVDEYSNYTIINTGIESIIFNSITGDIVNKFASEKTYCFNGIKEEGELFSLFTCDNKEGSLKETDFLIVTKKETKDLSKTCDSLMIQDNILNCVKDETTYILNSKYEIAYEYFNSNIAYIDGDNYAIQKDDKLTIYKDGKKEKELDIEGYQLRSSKVEGDMYLIYKDNKHVFYNTKGKKVFTIKADKVSPLTSLGVAFVEDDKKVYLIDEYGKKISKKYDTYYNDGNYIKVSNDNKYGIIDNKGKVIVDLKYDEIYKREVRENIYYTLEKDKKIAVYSVTDDKIIVEDIDTVNYYDHYLIAEKDNKEIYYTYNGKDFYSIEKTDK